VKKVKSLGIFILCLATVFVSGCWDQKIFEDIGFALVLGLEQSENGELQYSMTMPVFSEEIFEKVEILSTTSDFLRQSRNQIRNSSGKRVEGGKTQHVLFSKELAEKGINNILDVYIRSPENPLLANIVIVDGSPLELFNLSRDYEDKPRISIYLANNLLDARKRNATPDMRIYKFTILQYCGTIDPIASFIGYDENEIEIKGSALFDKDKMVGTIGFEETGLLHALMGEKIHFGYYIKAQRIEEDADPEKRGVVVSFNKVKRKVKTKITGAVPEIKISLDLSGNVDEKDLDISLDKPEEKKELEEKVSMLIREDCMKLLGFLQKVGSDPVGFGEIIRVKHNDYFKSIVWKSVYPQVIFDVDVKINFEAQGALN